MINTVTFNPSLDYVIKLDQLNVGETNRSNNEEIYPGGKGINVAIVSKNLGQEVRAFGFLAGFTGQEIDRMINEYEIKDEFIKLEEGMTRINVKIKSAKETEINGSGPDILQSDIRNLYEKLETLQDGEYLVLAGSIPNTMPQEIYKQIMNDFAYKNLKIVVDATGKLLMNVLEEKPFLIKPNISELEEMFWTKIENEEEVIKYARELQKMGAQNVIVSMGGNGALMLTAKGKILKRKVPKGRLINSVGAGDSMVAGFLVKYIETQSYEKAFDYAVATGSATAFSMELAQKNEVEELLKQMHTL